MRKGYAFVFIAIVATGLVLTAAQSPPVGPTFEVVSIKRNAASQSGRFENPINQQRPDGGFTMTRVAVGVLISRAYEPASPGEIGAPMRDRFGDGQGRLGDLLEGETTIANLAEALRFSTRRLVVDKTGLSGTYHMRMSFADALPGRGGPDIAPDPDAPASVFTAIREQLGLKLESSQAQRDTLIVDHLERPTEN